MPGRALGPRQTLWRASGGEHYCSHMPCRETEAQRGESLPTSHSMTGKAAPGVRPRASRLLSSPAVPGTAHYRGVSFSETASFIHSFIHAFPKLALSLHWGRPSSGPWGFPGNKSSGHLELTTSPHWEEGSKDRVLPNWRLGCPGQGHLLTGLDPSASGPTLEVLFEPVLGLLR